jgi:hypothetical protein
VEKDFLGPLVPTLLNLAPFPDGRSLADYAGIDSDVASLRKPSVNLRVRYRVALAVEALRLETLAKDHNGPVVHSVYSLPGEERQFLDDLTPAAPTSRCDWRHSIWRDLN